MKTNKTRNVLVFDLERDLMRGSEGIRSLVKRLRKFCSGNEVIVVTEKNREDVRELAEHLPVTVLAEYGAVIMEGNEQHEHLQVDDSWKPLLQKHLAKLCRYTGVRTAAEDAHSLLLDCDFCEMEDLRQLLSPFISKFNLQWVAGSRFVKIISAGADKSLALYQLALEKGCRFTYGPGLHSSAAVSGLSVA